METSLSRTRLYFRGGLLLVLLASLVFFATMVTLRTNRSAHWYVVKNYQAQIFYADILQNRLINVWQDDQGDYQTAERLLADGFFSRQYTQAGVIMMRDLADKGHEPARQRYSALILRGYDVDENDVLVIGRQNPEKAARYMNIAQAAP